MFWVSTRRCVDASYDSSLRICGLVVNPLSSYCLLSIGRRIALVRLELDTYGVSYCLYCYCYLPVAVCGEELDEWE